MANTYFSTIYHLVFCPKYRQDVFHESIRDSIFNVIGAIIKEEDAVPLIVGGYTDHIHILASIKPKYSVSEFVMKIKAKSNIRLKKYKLVKESFEWQIGYGAFTVSKRNMDTVYNYIKNQDIHHQNKSFKKEYVSILKEEEIDFDERFLFEFFD